MPRVLVVADDLPIRHFIRIVLGANGCEVHEADDVPQAVAIGRSQCPQLVIVEIEHAQHMLSVLPAARWGGSVPVIAVSAPGQNDERPAGVTSLPAITPFIVSELLGQASKALGLPEICRRADRLQMGNLQLDLVRRSVAKSGEPVRLSPREFDVLLCLAANPDTTIAEGQILQAVWGPAQVSNRGLVRSYVGRLRKKLEDYPLVPRHLASEPGVGYRLGTRLAKYCAQGRRSEG